MKQKLVILDQTTGEIRGNINQDEPGKAEQNTFSIFYEALAEDKISLSALNYSDYRFNG
jgi:hypothetical protein